MVNFQGEYINSIDPKGRASIPAKFREVLSGAFGDERLMLTKRNGGLVAYPMAEWQAIMDRVSAMPPGASKDDILRVMIAPAVECSFDKQGRIQVPQSLRAYAGLEKDVVVIGMDRKMEVWSQIRHAEVTRQTEERLFADHQSLAQAGF